jgi:hypothetical protein
VGCDIHFRWTKANATWEIPRLCRGGSQSLTVPGLCFQPASQRNLREARSPGFCFCSCFCFHRLRSGPFEGPATVKPPALPMDTYSAVKLCVCVPIATMQTFVDCAAKFDEKTMRFDEPATRFTETTTETRTGKRRDSVNERRGFLRINRSTGNDSGFRRQWSRVEAPC